MTIPHHLVISIYHTVLPLVQKALLYSHSRFSHAARQDALSSAIEAFLESATPPVAESLKASFRWLYSAAIFALQHEEREMSRFISSSASEGVLASIKTTTGLPDIVAEHAILMGIVVKHLSASVAETLWLHDVESCTPREISDFQGISVTAVKARVTRSRRILRVILGHDRPETYAEKTRVLSDSPSCYKFLKIVM